MTNKGGIMYTSYSSSYTLSYKQGYIHGAFINGHEVIRVQVDAYAYVIQVRSLRAAKLYITAHVKKYGSIT